MNKFLRFHLMPMVFVSATAFAGNLKHDLVRLYVANDGTKLAIVKTKNPSFPAHVYWGKGTDLYQVPLTRFEWQPFFDDDNFSWLVGFYDPESGDDHRLFFHDNKAYNLGDNHNIGSEEGKVGTFSPGVFTTTEPYRPGRLPIESAKLVFTEVTEKKEVSKKLRGTRFIQLKRLALPLKLSIFRSALGKLQDGRLFMITHARYNTSVGYNLLTQHLANEYEVYVGHPGDLQQMKVKSLTQNIYDGSVGVDLSESELRSIYLHINMLTGNVDGSYGLTNSSGLLSIEPIVDFKKEFSSADLLMMGVVDPKTYWKMNPDYLKSISCDEQLFKL